MGGVSITLDNKRIERMATKEPTEFVVRAKCSFRKVRPKKGGSDDIPIPAQSLSPYIPSKLKRIEYCVSMVYEKPGECD